MIKTRLIKIQLFRRGTKILTFRDIFRIKRLVTLIKANPLKDSKIIIFRLSEKNCPRGDDNRILPSFINFSNRFDIILYFVILSMIVIGI